MSALFVPRVVFLVSPLHLQQNPGSITSWRFFGASKLQLRMD